MSCLTGISCPDLFFKNWMMNTWQAKATITELIKANKVLTSSKNHQYKKTFSILAYTSLTLTVFQDASFRNMSDGRGQGGFIILLADGRSNSNSLIWVSRRIERLVKATLAAETLSLAGTAKNAFLLANYIEETMPHKKKVNPLYVTQIANLSMMLPMLLI